MQNITSPSKKFALFWLLLMSGVVLGNYFVIPLNILIWITLLWLVLWISKQEINIELTALSITAVGTGMILWQLTSGESWLHIGALIWLQEQLIILRDLLIDRIVLALPEPHGSLLSGILFGNRIKLDQDLIETFRIAGLSHLIAVSGYNLTVLTANARSIFRPLLGRSTVYLSAALILVFVLLSGAPSSILRAALMASILLLADFWGRPNSGVIALIAAAGLLVVFQPKMVFDVGFQLSIAATYGLIRLAPILAQQIKRLRLPAVLQNVLAETFAATILTAPIIVAVFERLSLVSPLTNIIIVPLIPLTMAIGLISLPILVLLPAIGHYIVLLAWPLLELIIRVGSYAASLPFAAREMTLAPVISIGIIILLVTSIEFLRVKLPKPANE